MTIAAAIIATVATISMPVRVNEPVGEPHGVVVWRWADPMHVAPFRVVWAPRAWPAWNGEYNIQAHNAHVFYCERSQAWVVLSHPGTVHVKRVWELRGPRQAYHIRVYKKQQPRFMWP